MEALLDFPTPSFSALSYYQVTLKVLCEVKIYERAHTSQSVLIKRTPRSRLPFEKPAVVRLAKQFSSF
jgi:hypothetical protein